MLQQSGKTSLKVPIIMIIIIVLIIFMVFVTIFMVDVINFKGIIIPIVISVMRILACN